MVGNLLTALFSTVGYCLLMNVPVKKIIPASVGGMLSWLLYLLLKDRVQSVFYLLVLVGAFAATYSEIAAKIAKRRDAVPASGAHPLVPGGSAYYAMLGLVQNRFADHGAITRFSRGSGQSVLRLASAPWRSSARSGSICKGTAANRAEEL